MGYLTGHESYEQIVAKMRAAIELDRTAGGPLIRIADMGEAILNQHTPASHNVGDACPKCADDHFPCKIMRDFIIDPD